MKSNITDEKGDFIFRFELEPVNYNGVDDPLCEFIRRQLEVLLNIVTLTVNDNPINPDGFIAKFDLKKAYRIFQPLTNHDLKQRPKEMMSRTTDIESRKHQNLVKKFGKLEPLKKL